MSKKFNIREWVLSVKYWSLLFIPHIAICLIFLIYTLVGASIIQEIESDDYRSNSSSALEATTTTTVPAKNLDRERDRLLSKIIDKRQTVDVLLYTKYINKHIREYEEEIKKTYKSTTTSPSFLIERSSSFEENAHWTFAGSLYFIGTTLTTIGCDEFTPITNMGKIFLMIYAAIGIPLTLVFLSDLSLLITRLIKYLSLLLLRLYSTKYFFHIRQWILFRFIERQLNISIPIITEEDDLYSPKFAHLLAPSFDSYFNENDPQINRPLVKETHLSRNHFIIRIRKICSILMYTIKDINDEIALTIPQLTITLSIYIFTGACLISSDSFFDSIYICFTSIFTINLRNYYRNSTASQENNKKLMFILAIYLLFGVAIVSLCIRAVQIRIQTVLENIGKKILREFVEFLRQMGFHELSTDDILAADLNTHLLSIPSLEAQQHRLTRALSANPLESQTTSTYRPIGVAEPVRRLSTGLIIRTLKPSGVEGDTNRDKSVQVNTIIRSCGRCAGSTPSPATSMLSVRRHNAISTTPSSPGENSSGCEEDDIMSPALPPPNLDRLRQRRATLVAKTIINQMATQPPLPTVDEPMPTLTLLSAQRHRSTETPPTAFKYSVKSTSSTPPDVPRRRGSSQEEFLEISKQISSLLTPSDDEN